MISTRFAILLSALWASSPANADTIHLACLGAGSANKQAYSSATVQDNWGNSAWGQVVGTRSQPFDDQVNVEINDDDTGRIRMPRVMLPPVHGGDDGWMKLKDVKRSDREITATAAVNFINSPKVRLDRVTGRISIDGKAGNYSGECQKFDPAAMAKRF